MKFNLKGEIKTCKSITIGKESCYGLTKAVNENFSIKILQSTLKDPWLFCQTLLHEMLHLYMFTVMSYAQKYDITEEEQHKVINKYVDEINKDFIKILAKKIEP